MFVIRANSRVNIHLRLCECVCTLAPSLAQRSLYRIRNVFAHHGRCSNGRGLSHKYSHQTIVMTVIILCLSVFLSQGRPVLQSFLLSSELIFAISLPITLFKYFLEERTLFITLISYFDKCFCVIVFCRV